MKIAVRNHRTAPVPTVLRRVSQYSTVGTQRTICTSKNVPSSKVQILAPKTRQQHQIRKLSTTENPQCTQPSQTSEVSHPFVTMFKDLSNYTRTENNSWTHKSSKSARLDLFYQVVPSTKESELKRLLEASWKEEPTDTLRLIFQLRNIKKGKGDKVNFRNSLSWLKQGHPKTLLENLKEVPNHGYWKDLLDYLTLECEGQENFSSYGQKVVSTKKRHKKRNNKEKEKDKIILSPEEKEEKQRKHREMQQQVIENARQLRYQKREERKKLIAERLKDPSYVQLQDKIADLFVNQLTLDLKRMAERKWISLAAKWAPSLGGTHEKRTNIATVIALKMFGDRVQKYRNPEFTEEENIEFMTTRARDLYRTEVYVPLRRYDKVIEVFMSANEWHLIPYNRVPSVCMMNNSKRFEAKDKSRFAAYIQQVKEGKAKISGGVLMPHKIIQEVLRQSDDNLDVLSLQWNTLVAQIKAAGSLSNCMPVCDVSGSMQGEPMNVAIALSLLVSQVNEPPFKDLICTFSANPEFHVVTGDSLKEKVMNIYHMDWGMNTDFQKVFDLILEKAKRSNLPPESMVKRVYVFSDMQFDECSSNTWQTDHMEIQRKFKEAGYPVPEIVYWNLRHVGNTPATADDTGVALVSGFSGQLLKLFMDNGVIEPMLVLRKAIDAKEFKALTVHD